MHRVVIEEPAGAGAPAGVGTPGDAPGATTPRTRVGWVGWWAGVAVVAAAAAMAPVGLRPFTLLRFAAVGVAVALAAASGRWRPPRAVAWVGAALLAWLGLATALAPDVVTALLGHPRRQLGLVGWTVGALAFLAGTALGRPHPDRWLGRAAVVAGLVTGAGAVADLAGWAPAGVTFAGGRVGGLLGQPTYLAALALLLWPVSVGVACDPPAGAAWRRAAVAAAAGCALAVAGSQTRAAWVGALVAGVVWLACRPAGPHGRGRRAALGAAVAFTAVRGGGGARARPGRERRAAGRLRTRPHRRRARRAGGRVGAGAVRRSRRPGGGHGRGLPDRRRGPHRRRLRGAPRPRRDRRPGRRPRRSTWPRRAGCPPACSTSRLLALVAAACVRTLRRPSPVVVAGIAVALVAWMVQQLASFPMAEVDPVAWLFAGVLVTYDAARPRGETPTSAGGPMCRPARNGGRRARRGDGRPRA